MEDLAETPSNCQSSRFENEVLVLTVKKYKLLIYYFLCVKLEKLTNSVSDEKKKAFWQNRGSARSGQISEGGISTQDLTEDLLRSTRVPGNFLLCRSTHAHKKHFRVYFGLPLSRR